MTDLPYASMMPRITWPALLGQSASNRLATLFQLEQSQWWSPQVLQASQFEQLRRLVPYAVRHVPHNRRTRAALATPEAITPQRWADVPVLRRSDIATGATPMRSEQVPGEHGSVHANQTGGSTGQPVDFFTTDLSEYFWKVFALREHLWHRRDFSRKLMSIRFVKTDAQAAARGRHSAEWGGPTEGVFRTGPASLYHIQGNDVSYLAERAIEERPGYILSHASVLSGMVDHFERTGRRPEGLLEMRSIGEMMDDDLRERARRVLGVPVVDLYSCQEGGYLASQCPDHDHYHVQSENVLLEVLDTNGKPCAPGEVGRVVITALHNFATPLIRYEVGDWAEVGTPCPCGRGLPVLKRVLGRYRNLVTLPSGEQRWVRLGFEDLAAVAPQAGMQMVQTGLEDIDVRLVSKSPLSATQLDAIRAFIHHNLGHPFRLRFEYVDDLRNPANGKIEHFISRLQPRK